MRLDYGKFQTYIKSDEQGRPTAMGINIPSALDELFPADQEGDPGTRFVFPTNHRCDKAFPFDHVQLNYVTRGHPGGFKLERLFEALGEGPDAINKVVGESTYFQRHFDVHFHLNTPEHANKVTCSLGPFPPCKPNAEEKAKFDKVPSPDFAPANLMKDPIADVPYMGSHWLPIDGQTIEDFRDNYAPIFGTFDGRVIYWEGMVTVSSLKQLDYDKPKIYDYVTPKKVHVSGYYPTKIGFYKRRPLGVQKEGASPVYTIEFSGMEWRLGEDDVEAGNKLTEDLMCPALDCQDQPSLGEKMYCNTCGTNGTRVPGKKVSRHKTQTSCECQAKCIFKADGFHFKQSPRQAKRGKKGKCTCIVSPKLKKVGYHKSYTSHIYLGNELEK